MTNLAISATYFETYFSYDDLNREYTPDPILQHDKYFLLKMCSICKDFEIKNNPYSPYIPMWPKKERWRAKDCWIGREDESQKRDHDYGV